MLEQHVCPHHRFDMHDDEFDLSPVTVTLTLVSHSAVKMVHDIQSVVLHMDSAMHITIQTTFPS